MIKTACSYHEFFAGNSPVWEEKVMGSRPLLTEVVQHGRARGFSVQVVALDIPLGPQPGLSREPTAKVQKRGQYWKADLPEVSYRKSIDKLGELRRHLKRCMTFPSDAMLPPLNPEQPYTVSFLKEYEDVLDSLVSARAGYAYATGEAIAYGDEDRAIWVPSAFTRKD